LCARLQLSSALQRVARVANGHSDDLIDGGDAIIAT